MRKETKWLSADWGTTHLRLRLVAGSPPVALCELVSETGISVVYDRWKARETGGPGTEESRFGFYLETLGDLIRRLEEKTGDDYRGLPVLVSGMASSTIGMKTLPYQSLPCPADGSGLGLFQRPAGESFPYPLVIISGVCGEDDVMRGEETMLVGAVTERTPLNSGEWFVFPGTHSKHLFVQDSRILQLRTHMTGELFALMSGKSILAASVEPAAAQEELPAFRLGLEEGRQGGLLHKLFTVRTADLLGQRSKKSNYCFLSGLLIGYELRDLEKTAVLTLVGSGLLNDSYRLAMEYLLPEFRIRETDAALALIRGQWKIAQNLFP